MLLISPEQSIKTNFIPSLYMEKKIFCNHFPCMEKDMLTPYGSTLPGFIFMFLIIYLFGYYTIFKNWGSKHRAEASSCLISLSHGTPAVLLAIFSLLLLPSPTHQLSDFASPNTKFQNVVLEFSIAYFFMDLIHYMVFFPRDVLFIAHHLATLYVFVTCRYFIRFGSVPVLILLVLAEITSPCQNTWSLARYRKSDIPAAAKFYEFLSPLFYGFYTVVRGILGPLFVYRMGVFYVSGGGDGDGVIPKWAWISWMLVIGSAVLVSMHWVSNRWMEYFDKERAKEMRWK